MKASTSERAIRQWAAEKVIGASPAPLAGSATVANVLESAATLADWVLTGRRQSPGVDVHAGSNGGLDLGIVDCSQNIPGEGQGVVAGEADRVLAFRRRDCVDQHQS